MKVKTENVIVGTVLEVKREIGVSVELPKHVPQFPPPPGAGKSSGSSFGGFIYRPMKAHVWRLLFPTEVDTSEVAMEFSDSDCSDMSLCDSSSEDESEAPEARVYSSRKRKRSDLEIGEYEILNYTIVSMSQDRLSERLHRQLEPGQIVNIVKIEVQCDRVRGQLETGGWISIESTCTNKWVWAKRKSNRPCRPYCEPPPEPLHSPTYWDGFGNCSNESNPDAELSYSIEKNRCLRHGGKDLETANCRLQKTHLYDDLSNPKSKGLQTPVHPSLQDRLPLLKSHYDPWPWPKDPNPWPEDPSHVQEVPHLFNPEENIPDYFCEFCQIHVPGDPESLNLHWNGKMHTSSVSASYFIFCNFCQEKLFKEPAFIRDHEMTAKHKMNVVRANRKKDIKKVKSLEPRTKIAGIGAKTAAKPKSLSIQPFLPWRGSSRKPSAPPKVVIDLTSDVKTESVRDELITTPLQKQSSKQKNIVDVARVTRAIDIFQAGKTPRVKRKKYVVKPETTQVRKLPVPVKTLNNFSKDAEWSHLKCPPRKQRIQRKRLTNEQRLSKNLKSRIMKGFKKK